MYDWLTKGSVNNMKRALVVLAIMATACTDKAKEPYDLCVKYVDFQSDDHWTRALAYCRTAVEADPGSTSGKAAAARLPELERGKKVEDDRIAAVKAAAAQAEAARRAAQEAQEAACHNWATICTIGRFPDGSEQTTGSMHFDSKAKCQSIGAEMDGIPCDPCRCVD